MTARKSSHKGGRKALKLAPSKRPSVWRFCGFCIIACLMVTIACMTYMVMHNYYSADGLYSIGDLTRNLNKGNMPASPLTNSLRRYRTDDPKDQSANMIANADVSTNAKNIRTKVDRGRSKERSVTAVRSTFPKNEEKSLRVKPPPSPTLDPKRTFFGFPCDSDQSQVCCQIRLKVLSMCIVVLN